MVELADKALMKVDTIIKAYAMVRYHEETYKYYKLYCMTFSYIFGQIGLFIFSMTILWMIYKVILHVGESYGKQIALLKDNPEDACCRKYYFNTCMHGRSK